VTDKEQQRSVLLCDREPQTTRALKIVLRGSDLGVVVTHTADDALMQAALRAPDAALIEMDLGDSSGTDVCRQLREWSSMPILIVTHVSDEDRMVDAFHAGADDYIIKPFRPRELVARLQAHLRRATERDEPVIVCGEVRIDMATRIVHRDGQEIRLTPTEHRLLCTMVRNRGRLLTHDTLLRDAWGPAYAEDRQTLRAHMANLRRKLATRSSTGAIRTYHGVGYLFENGDPLSSAQTPLFPAV
jgi:two-component system KDP operon response regulator KdpE